jgi:hypothetical protein
MSNKTAYRVEPSKNMALHGKDGAKLGTLHHHVKDHSGEICYAILAFNSEDGNVIHVPLPWSLIAVDPRSGTCKADIDHLQLLGAPHCRNIADFDADFAGQIDAAFGLEFPGIEALNDFA